ncbi:MAG: winged helix-turn-helix domain-containing protein [Nitrososphaerales archaeon]
MSPLSLLSSEVRVKLIQLLSKRPRTLAELSDELGVTVQAIMKHIAQLQKIGMVKEIEVESLLVRKAYKLIVPIWINFDKKEDLNLIQMAYSTKAYHQGEDDQRRELYSLLLELEDYSKMALIKLSLLRKRQLRLLKELCEILGEEESILASNNISPLEEVVIKASLEPNYKEELIKISKAFKVNFEKIMDIINKYNLPRP